MSDWLSFGSISPLLKVEPHSMNLRIKIGPGLNLLSPYCVVWMAKDHFLQQHFYCQVLSSNTQPPEGVCSSFHVSSLFPPLGFIFPGHHMFKLL